MAQSPSGGQVHADDGDGDALRVTPEAARSPEPLIEPAVVKIRGPSRVFTFDPHDNQVRWQILCRTQEPERLRNCSYLGFSTTGQMRTWEESDPVRWKYIKTISSAPIVHCKVIHTDVMRIICNDGGAPASAVAYIESLKPWVLCSDGNEDFKQNVLAVSVISKTQVGPAQATLRVAMGIVWLIRKSAAQFPDSGYFNTPYFWYAPEDVNRALKYLSNLRIHPEERKLEGTQPDRLAKQVRQGKDMGLASPHNSVSEGEWAGRFLRKDIVANQEETPEEQEPKTDRWSNRTDKRDKKTGQWRNKAEIRSEDIAAQLLRIRTWSYNTYTFSNPTDET